MFGGCNMLAKNPEDRALRMVNSAKSKDSRWSVVTRVVDNRLRVLRLHQQQLLSRRQIHEAFGPRYLRQNLREFLDKQIGAASRVGEVVEAKRINELRLLVNEKMETDGPLFESIYAAMGVPVPKKLI